MLRAKFRTHSGLESGSESLHMPEQKWLTISKNAYFAKTKGFY